MGSNKGQTKPSLLLVEGALSPLLFFLRPLHPLSTGMVPEGDAGLVPEGKFAGKRDENSNSRQGIIQLQIRASICLPRIVCCLVVLEGSLGNRGRLYTNLRCQPCQCSITNQPADPAPQGAGQARLCPRLEGLAVDQPRHGRGAGAKNPAGGHAMCEPWAVVETRPRQFRGMAPHHVSIWVWRIKANSKSVAFESGMSWIIVVFFF